MKILPAQAQLFRLMLAALMAMVVALLAGCQPNEQQIAAAREEKRLECLNKFCQGDVDPRQDYIKDALLKFNGQWYIGPKEYFSSGTNGAHFSWPSKKASGEVPKEELEFPDFHKVHIFIRGRAQWPDEVKNNPTPWKRKNGDPTFEEEMKQEGYRVERQLLDFNVERTKYFDTQEKPYGFEFFNAINEQEPLGESNPGIGCRSPNGSEKTDEFSRCAGGFYWTQDLYVDFRMSGKYVHDWPKIYKEIIRVLQLLKNA